MGNTVCTDRKVLTTEEIQAERLKFVPNPEQIREWEKSGAFEGYEHNFRAFSFHFNKSGGSGTSSGTTSGASSPKAAGRSGVQSVPINLGEDVQLDPTHSYVIMHLQRVPVSKATPPKGHDYPQPEPEFEAFAKTCDRVFTPRGISAMFSVDISALKRRSLDTNQQPFVYLFKLYVYNGKKATSLVSAVAVMSAFTLEKMLLKNTDFVAAMFYNTFSTKAPAPFHIPTTLESALSASSSPRGQDSMTMFRDHAFLRSFYNMLSPSEQAMNNTNRSVLSTADTSPNSTVRRVMPPIGGGGGGLSMPALNFGKVQTIIPEDRDDAPNSAASRPAFSLNLGGGGGAKPGGMGLGLNLGNLKTKLAEAKATSAAEGEEEVPDAENPNAREERLLALKLVASEVYPGVFVGGEYARQELANLLEKNISVVVNAVGTIGNGSLPNLFPKEFEYLNLQLSDDPTETIDAFFPSVNQLIDTTTTEKKEGVYVHCHQGVSRSASLALAYMMWKEGLTFETARLRAREKRNIISPNSGFIARLIMWAKHLSAPRNRVMYHYARHSRGLPFPYSVRMVLPSATTNLIDSTSCYVALERPDSDTPYTVTFYSGSECDDTIADDARELMETLLPYAFYTGKPTTDGDVSFKPVSFDFGHVREIRGNFAEFADTAKRVLETSDVVEARQDPDADLDVILEKYLEMMEERRAQNEGASRRKRNREAKLEEERRNKELEEQEAPSARAAPNPFAGGGFGLKLGAVAPPPVVVSNDYNEVHVYEYPFDGPDRNRVDFIDREDLQPDQAYTLVFIAQNAESEHEIVLYKGGDCDVDDAELLQAYTTHFVDADDDDDDARGLAGNGIIISSSKPARASTIRVQIFNEANLPREFERRLE